MIKNNSKYGKTYQFEQYYKYKNRKFNHWKYRIKLAHDLVAKYALSKLSKKEKRHIIVIDIGCSIGTFAIEFAKLGYRTYGIDFDPVAIKLAKQLCREEKVNAEFICENILDWGKEFHSIDIIICFDVFEHLHDDELGVLLKSIRERLSDSGSLIFHTFPTQYDYLFFGKNYISIPLILFKNFPPHVFNLIVKIYVLLIDIALLIKKKMTFKEYISSSGHCNPLTKERLYNLLKRAGYNIIYIDTSQIYPFKKHIQRLFSKQSISHRNLFGIASPKF